MLEQSERSDQLLLSKTKDSNEESGATNKHKINSTSTFVGDRPEKLQMTPSLKSQSTKNAIRKKGITERVDIYGNKITRKNRRKVKISFADTIENGTKDQLAQVINIESYKKYNYDMSFSIKDIYPSHASDTVCCSCNIF